MKTIANKINYFTPIDDKGIVHGIYYLDQCGNVVTFDGHPTQVFLPYVISVNVENMDDVCTMHISEIDFIHGIEEEFRDNEEGEVHSGEDANVL